MYLKSSFISSKDLLNSSFPIDKTFEFRYAYNFKNKFLIYNNYKLKCAIGKRGIKHKKREGDKSTPKGLFKLKYVLYRKDKLKKPKTALKTKILKKYGMVR